MHFIAILVKILVSFILIGLSGLGIARATLPGTVCDVLNRSLEKLELEKMRYADVARTFGCDGILKSREDIGDQGKLVIEDYSWRLAVSPYGRFDGHFINGTLHGTAQRWFISAGRPPRPEIRRLRRPSGRACVGQKNV